MTSNDAQTNSSEASAKAEQTRIEWLPAGSWILYDLANTIYAAAITYVLIPYFSREFQYLTAIGLTQTLTMVASGLAAPVMATICDRTGQTRLYLTVFTLICIGSMFGWSLWAAQLPLLVLLAIGNFSYQNSLVFYNALLPSVAPIQRTGLISGMGVGLGYFGSVITILVALLLSKVWGLEFKASNAVLAVLFLVTALPCLVIVRERREIDRQPLSLAVVRERLAALKATIFGLRHNRTVLLFFVGNFFLVDVLNTAIWYFALFTENIFQPLASQNELIFFGSDFEAGTFAKVVGLVLCTLAVVFGTASGYLSDRIHPLRVLRGSGWCLLIGLVGAILTGGRSPLLYLITLGGAGAFGLAGIWTAGRKVLLLIAPKEDIAQYFGLYGITLKLSVVGNTTFAIIADVVYDWQMERLGEELARSSSQKYAIGFQLIQLILGLGLLYAIRVHNIPNPSDSDACTIPVEVGL